MSDASNPRNSPEQPAPVRPVSRAMGFYNFIINRYRFHGADPDRFPILKKEANMEALKLELGVLETTKAVCERLEPTLKSLVDQLRTANADREEIHRQLSEEREAHRQSIDTLLKNFPQSGGDQKLSNQLHAMEKSTTNSYQQILSSEYNNHTLLVRLTKIFVGILACLFLITVFILIILFQ